MVEIVDFQPSAQEAIEKTTGPCLILAGPGTGKTTTLVHKIKHLVESGSYRPSEILCLTFSKEAADNIRAKVDAELKDSSDIQIMTYHSFSADVLREEGKLIDVDPNFGILDPQDARIMFRRDVGVGPDLANRYQSSISTATDLEITLDQIREHTTELERELKAEGPKNEGLDGQKEKLELELQTLHLQSAAVRKDTNERRQEIRNSLRRYGEYADYRDFVKAWERYIEVKRVRNYLDFGDLTAKALRLFDEYGSETFSRKYKYVVVDELQDTNKLQLRLLEHIAGGHRNLTAVGDENQSIYGFRGAYRDIFNEFRERFAVNERSDEFRLDRSYRSPDSVLLTAHELILNNFAGHPEDAMLVKNFEGRKGENVKLIQLKNGAEEARKIAETVEHEIEGGTPMKEICVLYRSHRQGEQLRGAFESKGIPIATAGETDLMQRPEIRTAISHLSIVNNLRTRTATGEQAWWALMHYRNALLPADSVKIGRYLRSRREDDVSVDEALLTSLQNIDLSEDGNRIVKSLVEGLRDLSAATDKTLPELVLDIYGLTGLNRRFTHERTPENVESLMNLNIFYELAQNYWQVHGRDLGGFISFLELFNGEDWGAEIQAASLTDVDAVRFMTLHATKGLEFDTVIISNLAEDRFPIPRARLRQREPLIPKELLPGLRDLLKDGQTEEEKEAITRRYEEETLLLDERRLCYVGMTRARNKLILTYAKSYRKDDRQARPSILLKEIGYEGWSEPRSFGRVDLEIDAEEKCALVAPSSEYERLRSRLKNQLLESLDAEDFPRILSRLIAYEAVRKGSIEDYRGLIDKNWSEVLNLDALAKNIAISETRTSTLSFDPKTHSFSPTALLLYEECPKKYELKQIYSMPQRGDFEGGTAADLGSFVHYVLEQGVSRVLMTEKEFIDLAVEAAKQRDWEGIDLERAKHLLRVFWKRNSGTYDTKTMCEKRLAFSMGGFNFDGRTDRVDFMEGGGVRIVDYKTGAEPGNRERELQLGFYAIAAKESLGLEPKELVVELLGKEEPMRAVVEGDEVKVAGRRGFRLQQVREELVGLAGRIANDYEHEFLPTTDDAPCYRCGYKFYCPKWEVR
jgi:DNA helicase-2/ATP-dependent DNA helicase PcrA